MLVESRVAGCEIRAIDQACQAVGIDGAVGGPASPAGYGQAAGGAAVAEHEAVAAQRVVGQNTVGHFRGTEFRRASGRNIRADHADAGLGRLAHGIDEERWSGLRLFTLPIEGYEEIKAIGEAPEDRDIPLPTEPVLPGFIRDIDGLERGCRSNDGDCRLRQAYPYGKRLTERIDRRRRLYRVVERIAALLPHVGNDGLVEQLVREERSGGGGQKSKCDQPGIDAIACGGLAAALSVGDRAQMHAVMRDARVIRLARVRGDALSAHSLERRAFGRGAFAGDGVGQSGELRILVPIRIAVTRIHSVIEIRCCWSGRDSRA
ncbi:hypothetical protein CHELA1G11_14556 [Hyphomicrobiales bacterium]|nr:hypothetical protein CHELA1G11_14556 [Hyphomicrobiales bacterium]CAH1679466.1 hypothetical protein CHELA1G2_14553 [Hyphomicrobiales bacterium]